MSRKGGKSKLRELNTKSRTCARKITLVAVLCLETNKILKDAASVGSKERFRQLALTGILYARRARTMRAELDRILASVRSKWVVGRLPIRNAASVLYF